jgi:MoaA/NifB/PqqE/SkfB family radical SAM enzyme
VLDLPLSVTTAAKTASGLEKLADYKRTAYAVWEITLKCNLACQHCGSRAGEERVNELSTAEAFDLIRQMKDAGITEITLIGGEAYLRPDWLQLIKGINDAGMIATMVTGGYGISKPTAQKMKDSGLASVSVSVDGLEATHDRLRGRKGSWKNCFTSMKYFKEVGLDFGFNTQINRLSAPELPALYEIVRDAGANGWQFSLTVPMGNAADHPELLIQPAELVDLYPMLARIVNRANTEGMSVLPGNDIGYFGPYEQIIRARHQAMGMYWQGCQAGLAGLGIEADGKIKGCPSLPTDSYVGGDPQQQRADLQHPRRHARGHRPPVGPLQDVRVRRAVPRRLHVDGARLLRQVRQQPALPQPRAQARRPKHPRAGGLEGEGARPALRQRGVRSLRGTGERGVARQRPAAFHLGKSSMAARLGALAVVLTQKLGRAHAGVHAEGE